MTLLDASGEQGFTLIEAMVALVILGIASVGIVRAVEAHTDTLYRLEQRAAADWVAQNVLAEASLPGARADPSSEASMLGWRWRVRQSMSASEDPDLSLITIEVGPIGQEAMVSLRGFVDKGTVTP
jgi:general secretion pathway protein I